MTTTVQPTTTPSQIELGTAGYVDVETYDVEIRLRGVDGTTARVRLAAGDLAEEFRVESVPGRLTIRPIRRWSLWRRRDVGPLELEVPRDAVVRAESASGSVLALDLTAGGRFRSASGDIDLAGVGPDVEASSVSGGVRVRAAEPVALRLKTTSGRIDAVAHVATHIDAHSVSGAVSVAGHLSGDGPFSLHSVSGTLTIATDSAIRLMASTVSGGVRSELPQAMEVSRGRTLGLGGEGPLVGARTVSGDIRVVPLSAAVAGDEPSPAIETPPVTPNEAVEPVDSQAAPAPTPATDDSRLDILRALERGDIDVAEAGRRLEASEASHG